MAATASGKWADVLEKAEALALIENEETEPYKSRYEAGDLLKDAIAECQAAAGSGDAAAAAALPRLQLRRGLILLETDLLAEGETCTLAGVEALERSALLNALLLQEAYNALGALWSTRADFSNAFEFLHKAEKLYHDTAPAAAASGSGKPADSAADSAAGAAAASGAAANGYDRREAGYTTTLFYLAQVHGHAKNRSQSARYCGATLNRQLAKAEAEAGGLPLNDWVQNCLQLAGYYVATAAYGVAEYCLAGAAVIVQQQAEKGNILDDDVAANVHLAWAKLYLNRLVASHEAYLEGTREVPVEGFNDRADFPDHLRFQSLGAAEPLLDALPWGTAALAESFEQARDLFNKALPAYKKAMEHYQLDGWVTEHVNILMEISNLYRCLADFESDPHRRCVMHKSRVKYLAPLEGQLSPAHFLGLSRSVSLELGNIHREMMEIKEGADRNDPKVAQCAQAAVASYEEFLKSFETENGALPDRIDADNEHYFVSACFSLGRCLHHASERRGTALLEKARERLEWVVSYVQRHKVAEFEGEARLAGELAGLIGEKLAMARR